MEKSYKGELALLVIGICHRTTKIRTVWYYSDRSVGQSKKPIFVRRVPQFFLKKDMTKMAFQITFKGCI